MFMFWTVETLLPLLNFCAKYEVTARGFSIRLLFCWKTENLAYFIYFPIHLPVSQAQTTMHVNTISLSFQYYAPLSPHILSFCNVCYSPSKPTCSSKLSGYHIKGLLPTGRRALGMLEVRSIMRDPPPTAITTAWNSMVKIWRGGDRITKKQSSLTHQHRSAELVVPMHIGSTK